MSSFLSAAPAVRTLARASLATLVVCASGGALAGVAWPKVKLPEGAASFPVGEQMTVNGMPMRIEGFVIRKAPLDTAQWFRQSMGKPLMENMVGNKLVLGRGEGKFYITVQLETAGPDGGSTRGTVAVTDVQGAHDHRDDTAALNARMLGRLPAGSRLLNQMSSSDYGKLASYFVAENGHSQELNRRQLIDNLRAEGLALERESKLDPKSAPSLPVEMMQGRTLYFKGNGKEATAVIRPGAEGKTNIVLNTVTIMQSVK